MQSFAAGKDEDWDRRPLPHAANEVNTIAIGQTEIHEDELRQGIHGDLEAALQRVSLERSETVCAQNTSEQASHARVVLYDEKEGQILWRHSS
jgi:hypothetical protein